MAAKLAKAESLLRRARESLPAVLRTNQQCGGMLACCDQALEHIVDAMAQSATLSHSKTFKTLQKAVDDLDIETDEPATASISTADDEISTGKGNKHGK